MKTEELAFWFSFPTQSLWPSHRSLQHLDPKQHALTLRGLSLRGARVTLTLQKIKNKAESGCIGCSPPAAFQMLLRPFLGPGFLSSTRRYKEFENRATFKKLSHHFRDTFGLKLGLGGGRKAPAALYVSTTFTGHSPIAASSPILSGSWEHL